MESEWQSQIALKINMLSLLRQFLAWLRGIRTRAYGIPDACSSSERHRTFPVKGSADAGSTASVRTKDGSRRFAVSCSA
jgi:hypothetical protein